jgi:hypothetical protein
LTTSGDRVLVTEGADGESRAAVAAVRALAAAGYRPTVTVSGDLSMAASSRHCQRTIAVPVAAHDPAGYAAAIRAEMASRPYLTVMPASDPALLALEVPVGHLLDKVVCAEAARKVGIAVPPSRIVASTAGLSAVANEIDYPAVVKPDIKRFMAVRVDSAADLARVPEHAGSLIIQPYLADGLRGVLGLAWGGRLVAVVHMRYLRVWPLPCGTVAAALTVAPDLDLDSRLEALLAGYNGIFHADFAGPYLLDLNPRIHATLPLAAAAGADLVTLYCDLIRGLAPTFSRGRPGVFFRWIEGDIRSIGHRLRAGLISPTAAMQALIPRRGAVHGYESLRDPGPLIARLRYLPRQFRRRQARRRSITSPPERSRDERPPPRDGR